MNKHDFSKVEYYDFKKALEKSDNFNNLVRVVVGERYQGLKYEQEMQIVKEMLEKAKMFDKVAKHLKIQGKAIAYVNNYLFLDDEVSKENNEIMNYIKENYIEIK